MIDQHRITITLEDLSYMSKTDVHRRYTDRAFALVVDMHAEITRLTAELATLRADQEPQPIETAPKEWFDGRWLLALIEAGDDDCRWIWVPVFWRKLCNKWGQAVGDAWDLSSVAFIRAMPPAPKEVEG